MKRLFTFINLILLATVSFYTVKIFYRLSLGSLAVDALPVVSPSDAAAATGQKKQVHPVPDIQTIVDRNLFKTDIQATTKAVAAKPVDVETLAPTRLNLKLWGTVASPGGRSFAVIEDVKNKRQRLIREDDQIENATVKKILRGKVILAVNGRDEVLEMEKINTGSRRAARSPARLGGSERGEGEERIQIRQSEIEGAVKNVNQLMKQVRIRPHFTNGRADGLRLTGIRSGSIFSRMGLRSGDVLVGVDGERIQSVDDALKFYRSLKSATNVKLTVKRGGREKTIDYQVE